MASSIRLTVNWSSLSSAAGIPLGAHLSAPLRIILSPGELGPIALLLQTLYKVVNVLFQVLLVFLGAHQVDAIGNVFRMVRLACLAHDGFDIQLPRTLLTIERQSRSHKAWSDPFPCRPYRGWYYSIEYDHRTSVTLILREPPFLHFNSHQTHYRGSFIFATHNHQCSTRRTPGCTHQCSDILPTSHSATGQQAGSRPSGRMIALPDAGLTH